MRAHLSSLCADALLLTSKIDVARPSASFKSCRFSAGTQSRYNTSFRWIMIAYPPPKAPEGSTTRGAVARAEAARPTRSAPVSLRSAVPKAERHALPIEIFRRRIIHVKRQDAASPFCFASGAVVWSRGVRCGRGGCRLKAGMAGKSRTAEDMGVWVSGCWLCVKRNDGVLLRV